MQGFDRVVVRSITPTVEATPDYSSDDVLGGLQAITDAARSGAFSGVVSGITISSKVDITVGLRIVFFKSNPSATTFTENSALSLNSADYDKVSGHVDISSTDIADLGTPNIATKLNINFPFQLSGITTLYAVCLARGTINLGSTSDLTFNYQIIQD